MTQPNGILQTNLPGIALGDYSGSEVFPPGDPGYPPNGPRYPQWLVDQQVPIFNVANYGDLVSGYGASFDNAPTILAAIAAAAAYQLTSNRYGAIVQLPAGFFELLSPIVMTQPNGVVGPIWFRGAGPGLTTLAAAGGFWATAAVPIFHVDSTNSMAKLSDFAITSTVVAALTCHGLVIDSGVPAEDQFGGINTLIERIFIGGVGGKGLVLNGYENRVLNVYVAQSGAEGMDNFGTDNFFAQCTADTCGKTTTSSGFNCRTENNKYTGCKAFGCTGHGYNVQSARNMFVACESQDNDLYGFNDGSSDNSFVGCLADTNGRGGGRNYGFWVSGSTVTGCTAINRTGNSQTYGYGGSFNFNYPHVSGCQSRLPGNAHVDPNNAAGSYDVNNLGGSQSVAYAAAITPDPYAGGLVIVGTITAALAIDAVTTEPFAGMRLEFELPQDNVGGHAVTFDASYHLATAIPTAASSTTVVSFRFDGAVWRETARATTS